MERVWHMDQAATCDVDLPAKGGVRWIYSGCRRTYVL